MGSEAIIGRPPGCPLRRCFNQGLCGAPVSIPLLPGANAT